MSQNHDKPRVKATEHDARPEVDFNPSRLHLLFSNIPKNNIFMDGTNGFQPE